MPARIRSCLIALTILLSSTGPLTAAQPLQRSPVSPAAAVPTQATVSQALRSSPVMFIENVGQFADGAPDEETATLLAQATNVAAGGAYTCALTSGGGVQCWGDNGSGQLGDGTTTSSSTPVTVRGLASGVVAMAAGTHHFCAVTSGGEILCWGANWNGQLGDGTTTSSSTPVAVSGLASGVAAVTAGYLHTCAVTSGGGVQCWGDNYYGQLGDGTTTSSSTPVAVRGLASGAVAVAAGTYHTCAVTSGGGILCWGNNEGGQLGDGTFDTRSSPRAVSELANGVAAIAAGYGHTCAVTSTGKVMCWGLNYYGQLGDGTTTSRRTPVAVSGLANAIATVLVSFWYTCALTSAGGVLCWGDNDAGQLGDGTTTPRITPVTVSGLASGVTAMEVGDGHTCAVTSGGGVLCWGANNGGQLGDGTTASRRTPVAVVGFKGDVFYTLSGRVTNGVNQPLTDVTVSAHAGGSAITDDNGDYTISGLPAGTYTLTPSKSGYSFTPARRSVRVSSDMTGVNFVGVDEGNPPSAFLDLPIPYDGSVTSFVRILHDTDIKGRISSWFDHNLPTYATNRQMLPYDGITRTVLTDARFGCYDRICYDGHDGIDLTRDPKLPATQPVPIRAAAGGVITATTQNCNANCCNENCTAGCALGNTVLLAHPNGYLTRYAHLDVVSVTVGTAVAAGTPLGTMGNTGRSCGTHLHFATYRGDPRTRNYRQVDPFGWRGLTDPWVTNPTYRGPVSYLLWLHDPGATPLFDGESGAAFTDPTGAIHASVPPGVFTGPVKMELSTGLVAAPSAQLRRAGQSFWLKLLQGILSGNPGLPASFVARASEMTIAQPITLTVAYSDTDVLHLDVSRLSLQRWNEGANAWQPLSATLSLPDRVITATTDTLGNFDLQAPLLCSGDTTEPDDSYDSAAVITSSVISASRLFDIPEDQDWFRLDLIGGKKYIVHTTSLGPAVDTLLEIYDIDGLTVLAQDDNSGGGQASRIEWQAPRDGTYFVRVSQASGSAYGCGATYELGMEAMKQLYLPLVIRQ